MKHLYILLSFVLVSLLVTEQLYAQDSVQVRELHTYASTPTSQADLPNHPLVGVEVVFDAVVISYPKNSGLASITSSNEPGRIHVFVTDVNAVAEGRDGMSIQIVVEGDQRTTLESLIRGDVIRVTGDLGFFNNVSQFDASDVELLGSVNDDYTELAPLLEPWEINLSEINQEVADGVHTWIPENYTKYIHSYVKLEGMEMIDRLAGAEGNRPWFILSDGTSILTSNDTSLRFRNDRGTYGYSEEEPIVSLDYNYRRIVDGDPTALDGVFSPPAPGSVIDISGFVVVNTFDPGNFDESATQSTLKIAPWDDGTLWIEDGTDTANRFTDGVPNDFVIRGFAPLLDLFTVTPDSGVSNTDEVTVSVDVLLPEVDYTLNSVEIEYSSYAYTAESGDTTTAAMTGSGDNYTFTFGTYADFTNVDYTITATAETPDGVVTTATQSGSFTVESSTQTAPVAFAPSASDTYINNVDVELSTPTPNADIYYTLDGSDPDETSTEYTGAISLTEPTTVKAVAMGSGLTLSPINERSYNVEIEINESSTLTGIRTGVQGENYLYTGQAVVTYTRSNRNQKYLMDASGGLLIDDSNGTITSSYAIGDVMSGLSGELGAFGGISQFVPSTDPGAPSGTQAVTPVTITLDELDLEVHESMLVTVEGVTFEQTGTFDGGTNYDLTDASLAAGETVIFRTNFSEADYVGSDIPTGTLTLTAIVGGFNGTPQLIARSSADFDISTSNEVDIPQVFSLEQNYPNPFNPTTVIRYSVAEASNVKLQVFDVLGRNVATLVNEVRAPGVYSVNFDATRLSSGTYFYRVEAGDFTSIKKMMLIK